MQAAHAALNSIFYFRKIILSYVRTLFEKLKRQGKEKPALFKWKTFE